MAFDMAKRPLVLSLYLWIIFSDFLDGYLARKLSVQSNAGKALDLFSDKYVSAVSVLFLVASGYPIIPAAVILLKEIFLLSMRSVSVECRGLFPPQRTLGGLSVFPLWVATCLELQTGILFDVPREWPYTLYVGAAVMSFGNLLYQIVKDRRRLLKAFIEFLPKP